MMTTNVIIPATIFNLLKDKTDPDDLDPVYPYGSLAGIPLSLGVPNLLKGFLINLSIFQYRVNCERQFKFGVSRSHLIFELICMLKYYYKNYVIHSTNVLQK